MSIAEPQDDRTLVVLNRISEMIAGHSPLPDIFRVLAAAAQELTAARCSLFVYSLPSRPVELYGSDESLLLGPALLQELDRIVPAEHAFGPLMLMIHAPLATQNSLATLVLPTFQGNSLRGALAAFYDEVPGSAPIALLTLLNNQARIAMEQWRLGNVMPESYTSVIQALASLIDTRDPYAHRHSQAVTALAVALAESLGLGEEEINNIRYASILHDIGKIGISETILSKPGPLVASERAVVEAHPVVGVSILRNIPYMEDVVQLIRHHHEHYDGSGYPDGLRGDDIPLGAQIIAIADTFEALTTGERSYHRGRSIPEACETLRQEAGKSLHPELVTAFLRLIGEPEEDPGTPR